MSDNLALADLLERTRVLIADADALSQEHTLKPGTHYYFGSARRHLADALKWLQVALQNEEQEDET